MKLKTGSIVVNKTDTQQGNTVDAIKDRSLFLSSTGKISWDGAQLTFSANLDIKIQNDDGKMSIINRLQAAASPISFTDDDAFVIRLARVAGTNNLASGTYPGLTTGQYALVSSFSSASVAAVDNDHKDHLVLFMRKGTNLAIPLSKTTLTSGQSIILGGIGDLTGSLGATDNKIVRTDGTTGKVAQGTGITIDDSDNISSVTSEVIGASSIAASALFELVSTTKGQLPARMTQTQRLAISSPAVGLTVYDTTNENYYVYKTTGGWTAFGTAGTLQSQTFDASGSWVVPSGVTRVLLRGCGGGGGAGGGNNGGGRNGGGSGGTGSQVMWTHLTTVPAASLTVTIGAGGTGATSGAPDNGTDGGDSSFDTITFKGGKRGVQGATTTAGGLADTSYFGASAGNGGAASNGQDGNDAQKSYLNGNAATGGNSGGAAANGGGGGGGGGNDFGPGGNGGTAGQSGNGTAGTDAANRGTGGGGGGGKGDSGTTSGAGGDGFDGRITVFWVA